MTTIYRNEESGIVMADTKIIRIRNNTTVKTFNRSKFTALDNMVFKTLDKHDDLTQCKYVTGCGRMDYIAAIASSINTTDNVTTEDGQPNLHFDEYLLKFDHNFDKIPEMLFVGKNKCLITPYVTNNDSESKPHNNVYMRYRYGHGFMGSGNNTYNFLCANITDHHANRIHLNEMINDDFVLMSLVCHFDKNSSTVDEGIEFITSDTYDKGPQLIKLTSVGRRKLNKWIKIVKEYINKC